MTSQNALALILGSLLLAQCQIVTAQTDPIAEINKNEKCSEGKEVFYRSQVLRPPNSARMIYVDTVLRRTKGIPVSPNSCLGTEDTPVSHLIEKSDIVQIVHQRKLDAHYVVSPKSFSGDGQYLVGEYTASYSGDGEAGIVIWKVGPKYQDITQNIKYCRQTPTSEHSASHVSFEGFISKNKFILECSAIYGDINGSDNQWHEIIDLSDKSIQKLSSQEQQRTETPKIYGSILSGDKITKIQYFPQQ